MSFDQDSATITASGISIVTTSPSTSTHGILRIPALRATTAWIRDDLEPLIARGGPSILRPDDVITVHDVLVALQNHHVSEHTLRHTRIHLAVREIRGKATRWPRKLVDEADRVVEVLEARLGPLKGIRTILYETGGRLHDICEPGDTSKVAIMKRFADRGVDLLSDHRAHHRGSQGFYAGQWWISGLFAARDGAIDSKCTEGGITCDQQNAYAIVLSGGDEIDAPHPGRFTYKCLLMDKSRFRLTSVASRPRYPVRVFRSHKLASLWAPKAGFRYDGLYIVTSWSILPCDLKTNHGCPYRCDVRLQAEDSKSLDGMTLWDKILKRPWAEEVDDYMMFRQIQREEHELGRRGGQQIKPTGSDGNIEIWSHSTLPRRYMSFSVVPQSFGDAVAAMRRLTTESNLDEPSLTSEGQTPDVKSHVDGSLEKLKHAPVKLVGPSKLYSNISGVRSLDSIHTHQFQHPHLTVAGMEFVEPFATLRTAPSSRKSRTLDGSVDSSTEPAWKFARTRTNETINNDTLSLQTSWNLTNHKNWPITLESYPLLGTLFKAINWSPPPRPRRRTTFGMSEDTLHIVSPSLDVEFDIDEASVSPRCSIDEIIGRRKSRNKVTALFSSQDG